MAVPEVILVKERLLKETQGMLIRVKETLAASAIYSSLGDRDADYDLDESAFSVRTGDDKQGERGSTRYAGLFPEDKRTKLFTDPEVAAKRYNITALNTIAHDNKQLIQIQKKAVDKAIGWSQMEHRVRRSSDGVNTNRLTSVDGMVRDPRAFTAVYSSMSYTKPISDFSTIDPGKQENLRNNSVLTNDVNALEDEMPAIDARITITKKASRTRVVAQSHTFDRNGNMSTNKFTRAIQSPTAGIM